MRVQSRGLRYKPQMSVTETSLKADETALTFSTTLTEKQEEHCDNNPVRILYNPQITNIYNRFTVVTLTLTVVL